MTSNPPPYPPEESKGLYPDVRGDPQQQPVAAGMTSVTYYPQAPQQQQNQPLVISTQPTPVVVAPQQQVPTFVSHIVASYVTTIFCCFPCALVAFILAGKLILVLFIPVDVTPSYM